MKIKEIRVDKITSVSKFNPRKHIDDSKIEELAKNIKETKLIHNIIVFSKPNNEYGVVSGQRRKLAFEKLGIETIPAEILKNPTDEMLLGITIGENIQRVDVNPIEMARAIEMLYEMYNEDIFKVADKLGKSIQTIRKYRDILALKDTIKESVSNKSLKLPIKTLASIAKHFKKEIQPVIIDIVVDHPQKIQSEIIREVKKDPYKIQAYAKTDLILKFTFKIISHDSNQLRDELYNLIEELSKIYGLIENIQNRFKILQVFGRFENLNEIRHLINNVRDVFNGHNESYLRNNYVLRHNPMKFLEIVLEHLNQNIHNYTSEFKQELSDDLLIFVSVNLITESILRTLKLVNLDSREFKDEKLPEILIKITKNQISTNYSQILLDVFEEFYFKDNIDIIKEVLKDEDSSIQLKKNILQRLSSRPRESFEVSELQETLVELFEKRGDYGLKDLLEKILLKIGKICSGCKSTINKPIDKIPICYHCNQIYCESCSSEENSLLKCSCGLWICNNCSHHFKVIDINNKEPSICDVCWDEGSYQDKDIFCDECIKELKSCSKCGKIVCLSHRNKRINNKYLCNQCSETEKENEIKKQEDIYTEEIAFEDLNFDEEDESDEDGEFYSYIKGQKINEFLTLKLGENGSVDIFVDNILFNQCKYLFLNIPVDRTEDYEEFRSIDEVEEFLDDSMENEEAEDFDRINPEEEFWGHLSNLQAWVENEYDTCLLHRNLAFPLLKKLAEVGDPCAKIKFIHEIAKRIDSGYLTVVFYLIKEGYLDYLTKEEKLSLFDNPGSVLNKNLLCALKSGEKKKKDIAQSILTTIFEINNSED